MRWRDAWNGISRDIGEILDEPVISVVFAIMVALPLVSLWLVARGRWAGAIPLAISLAVFGAWFLYYATDWIPAQSSGVSAPAFLLVLAGWAVALVALRR